ncbi:MAG: hypothetical protein HDS23_04285 [Bacteroides sp.]|nr:hypothetical protein [Bacteroides sp.]
MLWTNSGLAYRYSDAGDDTTYKHQYPPNLNQPFHFGADGTELPGGQQTEFPRMIFPAPDSLDAYIDAKYGSCEQNYQARVNEKVCHCEVVFNCIFKQQMIPQKIFFLRLFPIQV